jgi:hypothetical protein
MTRKILAAAAVALTICASEGALAQLMSAVPYGTRFYQVQARRGPGSPWRNHFRTRSRRRAYTVAAQVRSTGYQARVLPRNALSGLGYLRAGYGRRNYGWQRRSGYRPYSSALALGNGLNPRQPSALLTPLSPLAVSRINPAAGQTMATSPASRRLGMGGPSPGAVQSRAMRVTGLPPAAVRYSAGTSLGHRLGPPTPRRVAHTAAVVRSGGPNRGAVARPMPHRTAGQMAAAHHAAVHYGGGGVRAGGGFHGGGGGHPGGGGHRGGRR